jgi:hypothetical protein
MALEVERSEFTVIDSAATAITPGTFDVTPDFSNDPAPAASAPLGEKLLRRLLSVFNFGAGPAAASVADLSAQVDGRWPKLAELKARRASGEATPAFERIAVEGLVRIDGTADWSYQRGFANGAGLPLQSAEVGGATELDRYVQNHVRLDLMQRLGL